MTIIIVLVAMAALNQEAVSKLDAQLTCAVCLDRYVDPRVLTCHHSFCKKCIGLIPQVREQGKLMIKCPICRESTQLSEEGASALPVAFLINNLLEIDAILKKTPAVDEPHCATDKVHECQKHNRSLEFYCETCEKFICFKCGMESHHQHQYDKFEKRMQAIKLCLETVLSKRIQEFTDRLSIFDVTEKNIKDQSEVVKEGIAQTIQTIIDNLQKSKEFHFEQVERNTRQKLQLNSLERGKIEKSLAELMKCKEFVEEEFDIRSQYQIQAAKNSLVKHIWDTCTKMNKIHRPIEKADTSFMVDRSAYTFPIGGVVSSLNCQAVCELASVAVPSQAFAGPGQMICIPVTMPISVSPEQVTTTLSLQDNIFHPSVLEVDEGYLVICLQPRFTGLHELSVNMNGIPVKGSPFIIPVLPSAEMREHGLDVVASGLKCPLNSVVTEDGRKIVVIEMEGSRVTILTTTGRVLRHFGKDGQGPGKFTNLHSLAVSSSDHVFVADVKSIQKFTISGAHVATLPIRVRGLVFHPQSQKLLTISKNYSIEVFNLNLTHSHSLCKSKYFVDACDLAVDTKGMVYVLTIKHGIHKFSFNLRQHFSTIEVNDQLCLKSICVDNYGNIYVTNVSAIEKSVIMLTAEGECVTKFGNQGRKVHGISVNNTGDLFVCCYNSGELVVYRA